LIAEQPPHIRYAASGASTTGVGGLCEDAWSIGECTWAVADGIGSKPRAVESARFAVEEFQRLANHNLDPLVIASAINTAALHRLGKDGGTTLVVALARSDALVIGHCGDSRALLLRSGSVRRLTRDHSLREFALDLGMDVNAGEGLDPDALVSHIGMEDEFRFDVLAIPFPESSRLLLITDGISKVMDEQEIADVVDGVPLSIAARTLTDRAVARGATDDCTAVLIEEST